MSTNPSHESTHATTIVWLTTVKYQTTYHKRESNRDWENRLHIATVNYYRVRCSPNLVFS